MVPLGTGGPGGGRAEAWTARAGAGAGAPGVNLKERESEEEALNVESEKEGGREIKTCAPIARKCSRRPKQRASQAIGLGPQRKEPDPLPWLAAQP